MPRLNKEKLVVVDVPLLFESGFESLCDGGFGYFYFTRTQVKRLMK